MVGDGLDRLAIGPHPLVPRFAKQPVGLLQHGFGLGPHLGRLRSERGCWSSRVPAELLAQGFTVAAGQGHGMMFRRHPAIQDAGQRTGAPATTRRTASNHPLHGGRCAVGRCYRANVARRSSTLPRRRTGGRRRLSEFRRCGRIGGRRPATDVVVHRRDSRLRPDRGAGGPPSARDVLNTACQYSGGISSPGPGVPVGGIVSAGGGRSGQFLDSAFGSACASLRVGRSVSRLEHTKNKCRVR